MRYSGRMPTIRTTLEPWREITVTEGEYVTLMRQGLVYLGEPVPPPPTYAQRQIALLEPELSNTSARIAGIEGTDVYRQHPDGAITETLAGKEYSLWPTSGDRMPRIIDGRLTFAPTAGGGGGYASLGALEPIVHARASVSFTGYGTFGGLACLALMESDIAASYGASLGVPRSPAHLNLFPEGWTFGVFRTHGGSISYLASETFETPLAPGDANIYQMGIDLDRATGTAILLVPDGKGGYQNVRVTDPDIGAIPAMSAFVEPYRDPAADSATQTRAKFLHFDIESNTLRHLSTAVDLAAVRSRSPRAGYLAGTGVAASVSASTAMNTVVFADSSIPRVTGRYGPRGGVIVTVSAYVQIGTGASLYWALGSQLHSGATIVESSRKVAETVSPEVYRGVITAQMIVTTGTPHSRFDLALKHLVSAGGVASIWKGENYPVAITAVPF